MLQRALEVMPEEWLEKVIYEDLLAQSLALATNPYGNFVLQRMVLVRAKSIAAALRGRIVQVAQHKYASNVLERLFEAAPLDLALELVAELMGLPPPPGTVSSIDTASKHARPAAQGHYAYVSGFWLVHPGIVRKSPIRRLLIDRYGNYVLQKALQVCPLPCQVLLADAVRVNADQIESLPYGRQMLQDAVQVLMAAGVVVPVIPGCSAPPSYMALQRSPTAPQETKQAAAHASLQQALALSQDAGPGQSTPSGVSEGPGQAEPKGEAASLQQNMELPPASDSMPHTWEHLSPSWHLQLPVPETAFAHSEAVDLTAPAITPACGNNGGDPQNCVASPLPAETPLPKIPTVHDLKESA